MNTNGFPLTLANSYGDSSKGGQMFNNAAYFGISSPTYGTFTMGRQSALSSDLVVNYDSSSGSNAWSAITFEGATGGGGVTENRIYDNSYEYRLNVGPVRLAVEAQLKNGGNSSTGNAFEGDVGFDYMGLSMDFLGGKIYDALSAGPLSTAQVGLIAGAPGNGATNGYAIPCSLGCVSGVISDNTVFAIAAKYTIGPWKLYGGYENIHYNNPDNPLLPGAFAAGRLQYRWVNNLNYMTTRVMQIFWAGVKYSVTPTLDIAAAYYGYRQNSFLSSGVRVGNWLTRPLAELPVVLPMVVNTARPPFPRPAADRWICSRWPSIGALRGTSTSTQVLRIRRRRMAWPADRLSPPPISAVAATYNTFNKISVYDPGIGLRYQF